MQADKVVGCVSEAAAPRGGTAIAVTSKYAAWLTQVRADLAAMKMPMAEWQRRWMFDFSAEYEVGATPSAAAEKAHRYWRRQQDRALCQECSTELLAPVRSYWRVQARLGRWRWNNPPSCSFAIVSKTFVKKTGEGGEPRNAR